MMMSKWQRMGAAIGPDAMTRAPRGPDETVRVGREESMLVLRGERRRPIERDDSDVWAEVTRLGKDLSSRELEVLRLMWDGHPNHRIARMLDLSMATVETHRANAYRKLGVKNSISACREALKKGLLTP